MTDRTRLNTVGGREAGATLYLHGCIRILRERWPVVAIAIFMAMAAAGASWVIRPKDYTAELIMYVSAQTGETNQSAYQGAQLSQQRVTSYVELVNSTRVTGQIVQQLGLTNSPDDLAKRIIASSKVDSVLIDVKVKDNSPERAAAIANAVGQVFTRLVDDIERPTTAGAQQPVAVRVVQPAAVPTIASSPGLTALLILGLAVGLVLGMGCALLRNLLDNSIKTVAQLVEVCDAPNLGTIAYDSSVPSRPLIVHEDPHSPRAEAFRQLRTNLQFVDVDNPRTVIAITSSLPSEGKTTTLANLAIALASAGQRVLVIDADLRRPRLANLLGVDSTVGLTSVLAGRVDIAQAVQYWSNGVDVMASGPLPPNPSELLASQQMAATFLKLRAEYDTVLVDTPPLLPVTDAAALAPATDGVLLVCRFKKTKLDEMRGATQAIAAVSADLLGTILTMVPRSGPHACAQYNNLYSSKQSDRVAPVKSPLSSTVSPPHQAGRQMRPNERGTTHVRSHSGISPPVPDSRHRNPTLRRQDLPRR